MSTRPPGDRCGRPNYMGQPLHKVGGGGRVCIDCFCFLSGSDPRDPAVERTARSGDGCYLTLEEWRAAGEPSAPVLGVPINVQRYDWTERRWRDVDERPIGAPLPRSAPWWARVLHWLGLRAVGQR